MKHKDFQQLHAKSVSELTQEITKIEKELVTLKMKLITRQETNVRAFKMKRHDLARIKSLLQQKQSLAQS